jgi:hypothetical protein
MKHIKSYDELIFSFFKSKKTMNIKNICKKYDIENYTINEDGSIDVNGDVNLSFKSLTELPLKFRNVTGTFQCSDNKLSTLEGCPKSIGGDFFLHFNYLTSLKGCAVKVNGGFECSNNRLSTLENSPQIVNGYFICNSNELTTLKGAPESIGSGFLCTNNKLKSLEFCPKSPLIECDRNEIRTLEHLPLSINVFNCYHTPIWEVWKLFKNSEKIEFFNYCDPIREPNIIILERLNFFLEEIGKNHVKRVEGYKCI